MMNRSFNELAIGESFSGATTVTEAHIVLASGLFGDCAPLHLNEEYAKTTRFGTRIAQGTLITGMMAGVLTYYFGENAAGYLEQTVRFKAPVYPGDTVTSTWEVVSIEPKERFGGGIVGLSIACTKQDGTLTLEGSSKLIVLAQK